MARIQESHKGHEIVIEEPAREPRAALNRDFVIESAERGELAGNWVLDLNRDLG